MGAIGVARIVAGLLSTGWNVLTPFEDSSGYDLVAEKNGTFRKIQVKSCGLPRLHKSGSRGPSYKFTTGRGVNKRSYGKDCDLVMLVALDKDLLWIFKPKDIGQTCDVHPCDSVAWLSLEKI